MSLYNFKTPSRLGRRNRPRRHHDPTWDPPEIVRDDRSVPVRTSVRGFFWAWSFGIIALGFIVLTWMSVSVRWSTDLAGVLVRCIPVLPIVLVTAVTPYVWWRRQRRVEAVMSGTLEVEDPEEPGASGVPVEAASFWAMNRRRLQGCIGVVALAVLSLAGVWSGELYVGSFEIWFTTVGALVGVSGAVIAPLHWYRRHRSLRLDEEEVDGLFEHVSSDSTPAAGTLAP